MICQASACALIIPICPLGFSDPPVAQNLRIGHTMLDAVVDHLYIMSTELVNEVESGMMVDRMTLSLPFHICQHKGFHARHGRPLSGGEAAPCPEL